MKRRIHLSENDLHRVIKESVKRMLKEDKKMSQKSLRRMNESEDYQYSYIGSTRIPGDYVEQYTQSYDTNMRDFLVNQFTNLIYSEEIDFTEGNVGFADQYCAEFDLEGEQYKIYRDRYEDEFFVVKHTNEPMNNNYYDDEDYDDFGEEYDIEERPY